MIRTVNYTKFYYAESEVDENNKLVSKLCDITIAEKDEKIAYREAKKQVGIFKPIKVEQSKKRYFMEDSLFFQYAKEIPMEENGSEE